MSSTPDTLTVDGPVVVLGPPPPPPGDNASRDMAYAAVAGSDEIVVLAAGYGGSGTTYADGVLAAGYALTGALLFSTTLAPPTQSSQGPVPFDNFTAAPLANGNVALGWHNPGVSHQGGQAIHAAIVTPAGAATTLDTSPHGGEPNQNPLTFAVLPHELRVEWSATGNPLQANVPSDHEMSVYDNTGTLLGHANGSPPPTVIASAESLGGRYAEVFDNVLYSFIPDQPQNPSGGAHLDVQTPIPGEPASSITQVAMAANDQYGVAWVDSGTAYFAEYYWASRAFGPVSGLDWGGASDLHVVALQDGGFAVSWMKGGAYKGEVFTADGTGGGVIGLAGDVAGVAANGDLYTVGLNASGQYVVQEYAINGASSGGGTGGGGTGGGTAGQTYTADNNGDHLTGTAGNDTFNLGRGGDVVTGNGGADVFKFAEVPWAGGHITDFGATDSVDLTGMLTRSGYTGSNPIADGYVTITADSSGSAQIWTNPHNGGGAWLVETLDGISPNAVRMNGDVVVSTAAGGSPTPPGGGGGGAPPPSSVQTSDANYAAPDFVRSITLTGSHQTVHANNHDTTIYSDNGANTLYGGTGDDVIHIGRGGDTVTGGPGKDVFVFDDIPWAAATIKDIVTDISGQAGDTIDVRGLLAKAGYTGSDPLADGYLKQTQDNAGYHIWANYNQPGNSGWWEVATYLAPAALTLANGVFQSTSNSGTWTTSTGGSMPSGYDAGVMTGSNGSLGANEGGNTLIDNGANNKLFDGKGNDTLVLSPTTSEADTAWGGLDTIVLNAHPTVTTVDVYALNAGERIDLHQLMAGMGYTGSDPIADGYIQVYREPRPPGQMAPNSLQIQFDPDGPGGAATWQTTLRANGFSLDPHYSDGWLLF